MHLRLISFYSPNDNSSGTALSVIAQHRQYLYDHDDDRHPRQAFLDDLHVEISKFQADGDLLIVCNDMNQDVLSPKIQAYFSWLSNATRVNIFIPTVGDVLRLQLPSRNLSSL